MNANSLQSPMDLQPPAGGGGWPTPRSADSAASIQFLDHLKELVFEHLARIESLAKIALIDTGSDPVKVEAALRERLIVLEAAHARMIAAAARRDLEWKEFLVDLEHDRKQLAESWQRLEIERLKSTPVMRTDALPRPIPQIPAAEPLKAERPEPSEDGAASERISREILRQFRSLQGDVRRTLKS